MYKVMVVEDDIPMLKYLESAIDWKKLGLTLAFASSSSLEALDHFKEVQPDILLTDIGLPHLNGLELTSKAIDMNPNLRTIFLTCHEEFSYAKKAVKLKADDYLIKDGLTKEKIKESLMKTISNLVERDLQGKENIIQNTHFIKSSLFNKLLDHSTEEVLECYVEKLNQTWTKPDFKMVIGYLPICLDEVQSGKSSSTERLYYTLSEFFYENDKIEVFMHENHIIMLLNYKIDIKIDIKEYIYRLLNDAIQHCKEEIEKEPSFIYIKQNFKLKNIGKSYQNLIHNHYLYFYQDSKGIRLVNLNHEYTFIPLRHQLKQKRTKLLEAVQERDEEAIISIVHNMQKKIKNNKFEPREVQRELIKIITFIKYKTTSFSGNILFSKAIESCWSMTEALDVFQEKLLYLVDKNPSITHSIADAKEIRKIDDYIANHIDQQIRSVDMAKHLHFNPSYFSRYFKRLTGQTFTEYVNEYKIKVACNYLLNTNELIENISLKVGYNERTYFSKVFKKKVGMTPSEYRKNRKGTLPIDA